MDDDRLNSHHRQILNGASGLTGRVWPITNHRARADELVSWGYLRKMSRSEYRLTEKGFNYRKSAVG